MDEAVALVKSYTYIYNMYMVYVCIRTRRGKIQKPEFHHIVRASWFPTFTAMSSKGNRKVSV